MNATTELKIALSKKEYFLAKIEKLNKKAAKLGVVGVSLTWGETEQVKRTQAPRTYVSVQNVTMTTDSIKLANWTLVGVLDRQTAAQTLVRVAPGKTMPTAYYTAECVCEHCSTKRVRNETFVVEHEDGTTKQVGRSCLKDFLGVDPMKGIWLFTAIEQLIDECKESGEYGYGRLTPEAVYLYDLVQATVAWTNNHGYVSNEMVLNGNPNQTTKSTMAEYFFGSTTSSEVASLRNEIANVIEGTEDLTNDIIEWAKGKAAQTTSEFWNNVGVFLDSEVVPSRYFGFIVCLPTLYKKEKNLLAEKAQKTNEYLGTIGKREIFKNLTVVRTHILEGAYGASTIVTFNDEAGRELVWFASGLHEYEDRYTTTIKATVKAHKEYNGRKQTIITRATEL